MENKTNIFSTNSNEIFEIFSSMKVARFWREHSFVFYKHNLNNVWLLNIRYVHLNVLIALALITHTSDKMKRENKTKKKHATRYYKYGMCFARVLYACAYIYATQKYERARAKKVKCRYWNIATESYIIICVIYIFVVVFWCWCCCCWCYSTGEFCLPAVVVNVVCIQFFFFFFFYLFRVFSSNCTSNSLNLFASICSITPDIKCCKGSQAIQRDSKHHKSWWLCVFHRLFLLSKHNIFKA